MKLQCLALLLFGIVVFAQQNSEKPRAIEPTISGEIGVNPVTLLTAHTDYYFVVAGATKWRGSYSDIIQTKTETVSGVTQATTQTVKIAVSTATAASEGVEVGELSVIMSPAAISSLKDIFSTAATSCAVSRLRRQVGALAVCAVKYVQKAVSAELLEGLAGSGIEIVKDGGIANLLEYFGIINSAKDLAGISAGVGAFATEVLASLTAILSSQAFSVIAGVLLISYVVWLIHGTIAEGYRLPKWMTEPKAVIYGPVISVPSTTIPSTTTDTYSYLRSTFMTDHFHTISMPMNTPSANALANVLERRFSELQANFTPIPTPTPTGVPCIKNVLRNCQIVLEFDEVLNGPKPCANFVTQPFECGNGPPSMGPGKAPTPPARQIIVVWEKALGDWLPPFHREDKYSFWSFEYSRTHLYYSVFTKCGYQFDKVYRNKGSEGVYRPLSTQEDPNMDQYGYLYRSRDRKPILPVEFKLPYLGDDTGKCVFTQKIVLEGFIHWNGTEVSQCYPSYDTRSIGNLVELKGGDRDCYEPRYIEPQHILTCPYTPV